VPKADAAVVEGDLQGDASAATATAGEHGPVVRQHAGRITVASSGFTEAVVDVVGLEHPQGVTANAKPGVVIEEVENLHVGARSELPVGDIKLPAFVGLLGCKP
jgi:hypothetical protein